jgi:hypothetical protein
MHFVSLSRRSYWPGKLNFSGFDAGGHRKTRGDLHGNDEPVMS